MDQRWGGFGVKKEGLGAGEVGEGGADAGEEAGVPLRLLDHHHVHAVGGGLRGGPGPTRGGI